MPPFRTSLKFSLVVRQVVGQPGQPIYGDNNLQSVTKILRPIPLIPISMLYGDVTAFGWTVLSIHVTCTSATKLSCWGGLGGHHIVLFQMF